jgi:hypothetical protein
MTNLALPTIEDFTKLYASNGRFVMRNLFWELSRLDTRDLYPPLFTTKPYDYNGLPSAYLVYMDSVDEYDAATKIVPNMKQWDALLATTWFVDGDPQHGFEGILVWREHMKLRDASMARAALFDKIRETNDVTASKAILAETRVKKPAGRKVKKNKPVDATVTRMDAFNNRNKA